MSVFSPETAARALFPKELTDRSAGLHFGIHLSPDLIQVVAGDVDGHIVWCENFPVENLHSGRWSDALQFISERNWGKQVFRKVTISFDTPYFTLVPSGFVQAGKEAEILQFQHPSLSQPPETEQLTEAGITLIYDLPLEIRELSRIFPGARFIPSVTLLLRYCLNKRDKINNSFFVFAHSGFMMLAAYRKGVFQLCNSFEIQGNEDVLYHLANAAIRLNIDMEDAQIHLFGNTVQPSLLELLRGYANNIIVWEAPLVFGWNNSKEAVLSFPSLVHLVCA